MASSSMSVECVAVRAWLVLLFSWFMDFSLVWGAAVFSFLFCLVMAFSFSSFVAWVFGNTFRFVKGFRGRTMGLSFRGPLSGGLDIAALPGAPCPCAELVLHAVRRLGEAPL